MTPCFPCDRVFDSSKADAKFSGHFGAGHFVRVESTANLNDIGFGQFGARHLTASWLSALRHFICDVFVISPEEQMVRANARRIVAAMENVNPIRYRPALKLICKPMSESRYSVNNEQSISCGVGLISPNPASIFTFQFVDLGPKAFGQRNAGTPWTRPTTRTGAEAAFAVRNLRRGHGEHTAAPLARFLNPLGVEARLRTVRPLPVFQCRSAGDAKSRGAILSGHFLDLQYRFRGAIAGAVTSSARPLCVPQIIPQIGGF